MRFFFYLNSSFTACLWVSFSLNLSQFSLKNRDPHLCSCLPDLSCLRPAVKNKWLQFYDFTRGEMRVKGERRRKLTNNRRKGRGRMGDEMSQGGSKWGKGQQWVEARAGSKIKKRRKRIRGRRWKNEEEEEYRRKTTTEMIGGREELGVKQRGRLE